MPLVRFGLNTSLTQTPENPQGHQHFLFSQGFTRLYTLAAPNTGVYLRTYSLCRTGPAPAPGLMYLSLALGCMRSHTSATRSAASALGVEQPKQRKPPHLHFLLRLHLKKRAFYRVRIIMAAWRRCKSFLLLRFDHPRPLSPSRAETSKSNCYYRSGISHFKNWINIIPAVWSLRTNEKCDRRRAWNSVC